MRIQPEAAGLATDAELISSGRFTELFDRRFHAVMAVEGAVVVVALLALTGLLWRRFAAASGRTRKLLLAYGVFTPLLAVALGVVVVAKAMTAAHPLPGLDGFLAGGW